MSDLIALLRAHECEGQFASDCCSDKCREAADRMESDKATIERLTEALERLAKLGNGKCYGNSDGNVMAQEALKITITPAAKDD